MMVSIAGPEFWSKSHTAFTRDTRPENDMGCSQGSGVAVVALVPSRAHSLAEFEAWWADAFWDPSCLFISSHLLA